MNHPSHALHTYCRLPAAWGKVSAAAPGDGIRTGPARGSIDRLADHGPDRGFVKLLSCADEHFPRPLSPEQLDYLTCRQARQAAEAEARRGGRLHTRFQELWSVAHRLEAQLDTNPQLCVHLNPVRVWARFLTPALLMGEADPPAEVLFFPAANAVRAAVPEPKGGALLNVLSWFSPCTVREFWLLNAHSGRAEVVRFCRDLARVGLVAFG